MYASGSELNCIGATGGPLARHLPKSKRQSMATSSSPIFTVNPYESHPSLTQIEADVLWEYAKLNQHIKDVRALELR